MKFKTLALDALNINPINMIRSDWWLITAGNESNGFNSMTASWGHLGAIWGRPDLKGHSGLPTAVIYVRPQRYTKTYLDREQLFSICVFESNFKKTLVYLGSHSGRDLDKVKVSGLTPVFGEGTTYFAEASMVFICKKLYQAPLEESGFVDRDVLTHNYENMDLHHMFIGEIIKVLVKD
jgi:hypothetical protein